MVWAPTLRDRIADTPLIEARERSSKHARAMLSFLMALPPSERRDALHHALTPRDIPVLLAVTEAEMGSPYGLYVDDPVGFVEDVLGETLWSKQRAVLEALALPGVKRVAVPAGFGLGKTHIAAKAVTWFGSVHPVGTATAVTTATRMRQVERQLWPHVRKTVARSGLPGDCGTAMWKVPDRHGVETVIAYGFCYDEDTEVLTRDGWMPFQKLTGTEDVATRSPDGAFQWQRPTRIVDDPYDGPMVRFKSQVYDLLVTPNHRMLVRRDPKQSRPTADTSWHIREAAWFTDHQASGFQIPATSTWDVPQPPVAIGDRTYDPEAFARFLGLYLAEGWTSTGTDHPNRVTVCQSQRNPRLTEVRAVLDAVGLPWKWSPGQGVSGKFYVTDPALADWLRTNAYDPGPKRSWAKRIPREALGWSADTLTALIDGLMLGDGHTEKWGYRRYLTTSRGLADDVMEAAQKAGQEAWIDARAAHPDTYGRRHQYRVCFRPGDAHRVPQPTVEWYTGRIGCVSVPNGIIYVRRNGRPAWCGNTAPAYDEAAMQGIHAAKLLLVVDEAGGIDRAVGSATRNLLTGDAVMLAIGNPATDDEASWFETLCEDGRDPNRPDTVTVKIAATDSPAVTSEDAGPCRDCPANVPTHPLSQHLVDTVWIADAIREHGEDAPYVIAKVNAEFPKGGASRAIPSQYVDVGLEALVTQEPDDPTEVAVGTSVARDGRPYPQQPMWGAWIRLGVDVAADGGDEFVIARSEGDITRIRLVQSGAVNHNPTDVAGKVLEEIRAAEELAQAVKSQHPVTVKIDSIGVGWGIVGILEAWGREGMHGAKIVRVNVAENPQRPDNPRDLWRPKNKRAEMWLNGRHLLTPDPSGRVALRLDVDGRTAAQLRAPTYGTDSAGRQVIEKKDDMKKRGVTSPDRAEALLLAVYEPRPVRSRLLA